MKIRPTGVIPPMTTPFRRGGEVDFKLVAPQVDWLIGAGSHGMAAGGSTGTRFSSGGRCACTAWPPIDVMPPARGPGAPPRLIVITVSGCLESAEKLGMNRTTVPTTAWITSEAITIRRKPAG